MSCETNIGYTRIRKLPFYVPCVADCPSTKGTIADATPAKLPMIPLNLVIFNALVVAAKGKFNKRKDEKCDIGQQNAFRPAVMQRTSAC